MIYPAKRHFACLALTVGTVALFGCSDPTKTKAANPPTASTLAQTTPPPAAKPAAQGASKPAPGLPVLQKVISTDMVGAQMSFIEAITGPPKTIAGRSSSYESGNCGFKVYYKKDNSAYAFQFPTTQGCIPNLREFFDTTSLPPLDKLTFGDFIKAEANADITFGTDCLNCGNGEEPNDYLYYSGPHVENFVQVELTGDRLDDTLPAPDSPEADRWGDSSRTIQCSKSFDEVAAANTQKVKVSEITVGFEPLGLRCDHAPK